MGWISTVGPLIIFFAIFYLLLIRPQQRRQKKVREMQSALAKGDKVVTIGGLHGVVDVIEDDTVTIKCNGNTKLTFDRSSVRDSVERTNSRTESKPQSDLKIEDKEN